MASLKTLFKDTAIYGMSSIVGRFLNYLLTPLYTHVISAASGGYGIVTEIYAYTAIIIAVLTFGMETSFFRFANDEKEKPDTVFSTTFAVVTTLALLFVGCVFTFIDPISAWMNHQDHPEFIQIMVVCVSLDAIQAIPFCLLRYQKKPLKFATIKLLSIAMNIGLNLLYFLVLGYTDVFYVFAINLACSALFTFVFIPEFFRIKWQVDFRLLRRILSYSWPILVLSVMANLNQALDKMAFLHIYPGTDGRTQLGIYGACVKVAMIMVMITQAFRFAYEPIVFAGARDKNSEKMYAGAMKYFILFTLLAFLAVMAYIDVLQFIIGADYREGLRVVPIVMAAEIMMGISMNLSIWYKLTDRTIWGAILSGVGCIVLIAVNILLVPKFSYMACAWGGFAAYATTMLLSYILGQKYYPIDYKLREILYFIILAAVGYLAIDQINGTSLTLLSKLALNTIVVLFFAAMCVRDVLKMRMKQ